MAASEARITANRLNSQKSCGPRTEVGKAASRGNALKHGLACETIAPTAGEAEEVERRSRTMAGELKANGTIQLALVARIALLSVRLDRCAQHEAASLTEQVERAVAEFDAGRSDQEDAEPEAMARARSLAADRALFDPSPEASLARRHEAAAERGLYRALRELRALQAAEASGAAPDPGVRAAKAEADRGALASFRRATAALAEVAPGTIVPDPPAPSPAPGASARPVAPPNPSRMNRRQRRAAMAMRG